MRIALAAAAALIAGAAAAQDESAGGAAALDANQNAEITRDEFQAGWFQEWRRAAGGDGPLTEEEFELSVFGSSEDFAKFDENDDGELTREEFADGLFNEYDQDGDGSWSLEEAERARHLPGRGSEASDG